MNWCVAGASFLMVKATGPAFTVAGVFTAHSMSVVATAVAPAAGEGTP